MADWWWSWLLTIVGVTGFILAGRKIWWAWYVNIGCQVLWFTYAELTHQYGFIAASCIYMFVFWQNAFRWTKEHRESKRHPDVDLSFEFKDVGYKKWNSGVRMIENAEIQSVEFVQQPPHPSWTVEMVEKEPKEPTVTRSFPPGHMFLWACENPDCMRENFTSPASARGLDLSNDRCPGCGERSVKRLTDVDS